MKKRKKGEMFARKHQMNRRNSNLAGWKIPGFSGSTTGGERDPFDAGKLTHEESGEKREGGGSQGLT